MLQVFESQGVAFRDVLIDDSLPEHGSAKRKPGIGMVVSYLQDRTVDWRRSAMVGERETDMAFARHLAVRGFQLQTPPLDLKSGVSGQSVSVRVKLGGRSIFQKNKQK